MPTLILLDVSLSMCRRVNPVDGEANTIRSLANAGLTAFLDALSRDCRLEFVSLMQFSSLWEKVVPFTRDHESIKAALLASNNNFYDKTNVINALIGAKEMVQEDWGSQVPVNLILVTDGNAGINAIIGVDEEKSPLPFPFPCKLQVLCLGLSSDPAIQASIPYYEKLIAASMGAKSSDPKLNHAKLEGNIWFPEGSTLSVKAVQQMFTKVAETNYQALKAILHCGHLFSPVSIYPTIESLTQTNDFETITAQPSTDIEIYGFMEIAEVASPPVHSRHLVFSVPMTKEQITAQPSLLTVAEKSECSSSLLSDIEESINVMATEDGKQPSLCVLLHGSLKIEGMVAICKIGNPDWYGMLYSWADNKKKSNLMLSSFNCGREAIKWLGDLKYLGSPRLNPVLKAEDVERGNKSYSQSVVVWVKQSWLQSDIQKILRLAKRLPEKMVNFYKELSKFRRAAFASGFYQVIDRLALLLERECTMLPGNATEAVMQLTHAITVLRSRDIDMNSLEADIVPMKTKIER
ncbi:hypothetical protein HDE_14507 [Halotydeus destructor]|nr:hypothetical protein HDE_14507 [Halotydeus destructor]